MYKKSSNVPGEDPQKCFTRNLFWRFLFFVNLQAGGWIVIKIALCCNFLKKPEVILRTTLSSCTLTMFLHLCLSIKNAYFPPNMYISFTSLFLWPCFWGKQIGLSQWQVWLESQVGSKNCLQGHLNMKTPLKSSVWYSDAKRV